MTDPKEMSAEELAVEAFVNEHGLYGQFKIVLPHEAFRKGYQAAEARYKAEVEELKERITKLERMWCESDSSGLLAAKDAQIKELEEYEAMYKGLCK